MTKKNKNMLISLLIIVIIAALFNVIYFVFPFDKIVNAGPFWISYAFTMSMFLIGFIGVYLTFSKKKLESKIFGLPIITFMYGMVILQFIFNWYYHKRCLSRCY